MGVQGNCEKGKRCIMADLIDREKIIDELKGMYEAAEKWGYEAKDDNIKARAESCMATIVEMKLRIENLPSAQQWIPFSMRKLTEEEKKLYPEQEYILDGKTPENGQNILVNIRLKGHEEVQIDEFYDDDGCYLYSGYEVGAEATHWMPLPEPYKEESDEQKN